MSNARVIVLYNSKEIALELDPFDDDLYNKLIKAIEEATGEDNIKNDYIIMSINSNAPYLLIDEHNLFNIINEERKEEDLKLFLSKNKNVEDEGDDECFTGLSKLKTFDEDFGELERISYTLQKYNQIKSEKNDINVIIKDNNDKGINENDKKINDDANLKVEEEKEKEREHDINKKSELLTSNNNDQNEEDAIKINNIAELFNNNNKSNKSEEVQNEGEENNIKVSKDKDKIKFYMKNNFFQDETCSICRQQLSGIKFICALCENLILCDSCESQHNHPCFVYKSKFISSLKETFNYISQNYDNELSKSNPNFFSKLITSNVELSIFLLGDKNISLRPNKKYVIPIKFINHTSKVVNSSNFILLITGNKLINISYDEMQTFNILPKSNYILNIFCQTPSTLCSENINMELYSTTINIKSNNSLKINVNIEINEDKEEESLNDNLLNDDKVILYNKEHKEIILSLLENECKGYNPTNIIDNLIKYNWNRDKCIQKMKSKEHKK